MAKHELFVSITMPVEVMKKDVVFAVRQDGKRFGELRISRGTLVWRGHKDQIGRKLGWTKFDKIMEKEGRRDELRPPRARLSVPRNRRK